MHLSMRGQVEVMVLRALLPDNKPEGKLEVEDEAKEMPAYVAWATSYVAGQWAAESDAQPITPADYPVYTPEEFKQSVQRGYQTFIKTEGAGCASCHIDFGRKNTYKWDEWGTVVRPANLLNGVYRGGRRPMDLYWRIHGGINGAQMPQLSNAFETPTGIWDMVNFVQVLPYPEMRKKYGVEIPE
jgi:hypothetical protein